MNYVKYEFIEKPEEYIQETNDEHSIEFIKKENKPDAIDKVPEKWKLWNN